MRESMEIEELNGSAVERLSPNTLSLLFKRLDEDTQKVENEDKTLLPQHVFQQTSLPFVLSFCNLTYAIIDNKKKKTLILNDVSGQARSGEILAILGTSGSGKSTLIDALANRIAKGSLKGSITLNGKPVVESGLLKVISGYVMQDDLLFPMLTVEETIMFSAEFRLPHSLSKSKKKARVSALIDQLGLRSVAKTMIGDEGHRGVSGGERRRVSIGIEIIHDPIILFLDEPTSRLDCTNAFLVVEVLKRIAQSGSIVIMSIHQPSYRILGLLSRLLFLSCGQIVYSGLPASLPLFFTEFGHSIPENENWVEFAFDLIHELEESPSGMESLVEFSKSWQTINQPHTLDSNHLKLSLKEAITASMSKGKLVSGALNNSASPTSSIATFANPFWNEIFVLSKRSITNSRRMPELIRTRLGPVMVTSFMLALVFRQLDNSPKGVKERLGFFGFALCTIFYFCTDALPVFILERYIFMRETANNAYRRSSYVLSTTIIVIPSLIFLSTAFAATTFWAVGLGGGISGFIFFASIIFALFWAGNSFVTFLSAIVSDLMIGCTVVVAIVGYFLLFSGISINSDRIPHYLIWLHYTSLMKYSYQAVLQNEFENERKCFMRGTQMFDNTELGIVPVAMKINLLKKISNSLGMNITSESCLTTGLDILGRQGIRNNLSKWDCLWITLAWGFFFRILFYFSLLLGSKNKRR